jgi:hypothetical protein
VRDYAKWRIFVQPSCGIGRLDFRIEQRRTHYAKVAVRQQVAEVGVESE